MKDLFEDYELLPQNVQNVLTKFWESDSYGYEECDKLIDNLEKVGYTCTYGLDAEPYNLTKI